MGKKGNRRTVLQLSDNKESFLARYGYRRQENDDEDSKGAYDPGDESEDDLEKYAQETLDQDNEKTPELNGKPADIDDKVADFLAEIDALPAPEPDEEEEEEAPVSFKVDIPPPSFKLSSDQQGRYVPPDIELPKPKEVSTSKPKYKSMFVKGESEFTRQTETDLLKGVKNDTEEPWPEEPKTVWQQTLDDNTQCFYYWNTVTNEVTWEIPSGYTQYLLKHKEYEATVDRLTKEGRVKPAEEPVKPQTTAPEVPAVMEKGNNSAVSSTSNLSTQVLSTQKTKETIQPDSTNKAKKTSLVDATYFDDSEDDSSSSSSEDNDNEKKSPPKPSKKPSDSDMDMDLDLDDIDKALEMALEKKKQTDDKDKPKESKSSRDKDKSSKEKKKDKDPKQRTLVDEMKAQVQKRQEVEARRKAAIEEMMARELERRVGPPRKRSSDDEPGSTVWESKRQKLVEYSSHSRKSRPSEHEHRSRRSSSVDHGDSKHKHDSRKAEKKKRREEREERRKERDEKGDRKRDRDRSREKDKKDKHKDDKKKDKRDKESRKDDKSKEKSDKKKSEKSEVKEEVKKTEDIVIKIEEDPVIKEEPKPDLENIFPKTEKEISKEVELANLKMQASELADLALSKLEFLEVTKKGLSKLQILLIELETRHQDWQGGGLNTEFFIKKLEEANWQLQQYEQSAAPPGWTCHWDRAYRRYFYMNKKSNRTQWDYPDDDDEEEDDAEEENQDSDKEDKQISQRRNSSEDPYEREDSHVPSKGVSPSPVLSRTSSSCSKENDQVTSTTPVQSDVTTTTDSSSKITSFMARQSNNESEDQYLATNKQQKPGSESRSSEFVGASDLSCLMRGEPPPPGTDLEILLAAPPPPPPPPPEEREGNSGSDSDDSADFESGRPFSDRVDREEDMEMDSNEATSSNLQTFSAPSEVSGAVYSPSSESSVNHGLGNNGFAGVDPGVIARAPQIFSSDAAQGSGDSYYEGKDSATGYVMPVGQEAGDSAWAGEGGIPQTQASEREKKKKKKDKTISSTNLTLKKKNVSSLVQKWQKVKKEVEIEERNREEREMAIRQKLEEWKQEHS